MLLVSRAMGYLNAHATMTQPKQIIQPLRYLRPLVGGDPQADTVFAENFSALLGGEIEVTALGRARGGIYLLVSLAVTKARRIVILSPYTIPDVVNMVRFAGGEPVFVDSLPGSTNVDIDQLGSLIDEKTACVFLTHYHVNQNQLDDVRALCSRFGAACFDDCAIALGGTYAGTAVGTTTDAGVFSLSSFKTLNFLWGGVIATRSPELGQRARAVVAVWPRLGAGQYRKQLIKTLKYDLATRPGVFSALFPLLRLKTLRSEVQDVLPVSRIESRELDSTITSRPALGALAEWSRKIGAIETAIRHRRNLAGIYDRYFRRRVVSAETAEDVRAGSAWVNYPIVVDAGSRNDIYRDVLSRGFDVGLSLYPNAHETPGFGEIRGHSANVSKLVRSVISLPTHSRISPTYAERLAQAVDRVLSDARAG